MVNGDRQKVTGSSIVVGEWRWQVGRKCMVGVWVDGVAAKL